MQNNFEPQHRPLDTPFRAWLRHHTFSAKNSLERLLVEPLSSLLTWLVIGIALALPAILYITLSNVETVSANWNNGTRISLFLDKDITNEQGDSLTDRLKKNTHITKAEFVTTDQAMAFFKTHSGLGDALQNIDENPFPPSIEVQYKDNLPPVRVKELIKTFKKMPGVQTVQLDMDWVQRLYRFMQLGKRLTLILICLLSLGVLLVVGNTIKLSIENRRQEIVIVKLVGGSNQFVRRPFLYSGFWLGLGGGLIAWLAILTTKYFVQAPFNRLMNLYGSDFQLLSLTFSDSAGLILTGIFLGWLGAWLVVTHHLAEIEPS
ncbi:MAG: permease-like cell division protein FtsX [Pseudomonadota bacterium]